MAYDRDTTELLLPTIWDADSIWGIQRDNLPPPDMPTAKTNPAHGNNIAAFLIDISSAWKTAPLSRPERRAVLMRFGLDWTHTIIAAHEGVARPTITIRLYTAVGKLTAELNGKTFKEDEAISGRHQVGSEWTDGLRANLLAQEAGRIERDVA